MEKIKTFTLILIVFITGFTFGYNDQVIQNNINMNQYEIVLQSCGSILTQGEYSLLTAKARFPDATWINVNSALTRCDEWLKKTRK